MTVCCTPPLFANVLQMHMLLHLEELQQEIDVRSYDMKDVTLSTNRARRYLNLEVPGLAEARPSVLRGDALYVSRADGSEGGKEWQGFVHLVRQTEVSQHQLNVRGPCVMDVRSPSCCGSAQKIPTPGR